jgi:MoaA/NifB/PqqE/SkfB family radical SAM enzyme
VLRDKRLPEKGVVTGTFTPVKEPYPGPSNQRALRVWIHIPTEIWDGHTTLHAYPMENGDHRYRELFDSRIASTFRKALRLAVYNPALSLAGLKILHHQRNAAALRKRLEGQGILVPAVLMISLTSRCNLACAGCYLRAQHRKPAPDMTADQLSSLVSQAAEVGVSAIVFAGGEPLLRSAEILALARSYSHMLFAVFSNGLLIDEDLAEAIADRKNLVPVISFEGFQDETDRRRGCGVYDRLVSTASRLREKGVFFGCSVTVTRRNFDQVIEETFIRQMMDAGAQVFVFVEYVPIEQGTEDLVLLEDQRSALGKALAAFDTTHPALFIGFPGGEEEYGGCLAAGRGFAHISASGDLEPCPAAPFSDTNITRIPFGEAIRSGFLAEIRRHHDRLTETQGGCALWTNRDWVQRLMMTTDSTVSDRESRESQFH